MSNWTPNQGGDGKLEIFSIPNLWSYFKKQFPFFRRHLRRLGQFPSPFQFNFKRDQRFFFMCDGEFYECFNVKSILFERVLQVLVVGKPGGRLVTDEELTNASHSNNTT